MKKKSFIIIILLILTHYSTCWAVNSKINTYLEDSLIKKFIPIIKGSWVMTDYINSLKETKSPIISWEVLKECVDISIGDEIIDGRLEVGVNFNNHEGYSFGIYFKVGQNNNSLKTDYNIDENKTNFYELAYEISKLDTFIYLNHYDLNNNLINKRQYTKVHFNMTNNIVDDPLQYITNEILITGKYLLIDNYDKKTSIEFTSDGTVIGWPKITTYLINTDFMVGILNNLDELCLNLYQKDQKDYAMQIKSDAIYLYETKEDKEHLKLLLGKQKYKLIKQ